MIEAENVRKTYRIGKVDVQALRGVSLQVEKGEFVTIVGPSGSGKSTLFYILGGLTHADTGRVIIDGVNFTAMSDSDRTRLRRSKIGFVFQKFNLLPTLTAEGNIEIARDIAGHPEDAAERERIQRVTQLLGIDKRMDHRPAEMSGGEQQRVALARALVNQPAIVLADEPTGNLDSENSEIVLNMLRQSNQELGQTVLMITHNPEAATYGDRIIHMRDGRSCRRRKIRNGATLMTEDMRTPILPGKGASDYERYLRTDELLALQKPPEEMLHPDELTFQVTHQASELLMKGAAWELDRARHLHAGRRLQERGAAAAPRQQDAGASAAHAGACWRRSRRTSITSSAPGSDTAAGSTRRDFWRCCTSRRGWARHSSTR